MIRRVKVGGRNLFSGIYSGNIIKNKNYQARKHFHKGSRDKKHFYGQMNIKPVSGEVEEHRGKDFEKTERNFYRPSALGPGSTEPS